MFYMSFLTNTSVIKSLLDANTKCSNQVISQSLIIVKANNAGISAVDGKLVNVEYYQNQVF